MNQDNINAFPRKKLFIDILTQDVSVSTCILDLIDNSVDSYTRKKLEGKSQIKLSVNENQFEIFDNCGGIDKDFLKENVFKFGSANREIDTSTLGMYGIGLKRSIFKLGDEISLETDDGEHYCYMFLNVPNWEEDQVSWSIPFEFEQSRLRDDEKPYTRIIVKDLHKEIRNKFELDSFKNDLIQIIKRTYCLIIKDSIDFEFNGKIVVPEELLVPVNDEYKPSVLIEKYGEVDIEIICFIEPNRGSKQTNSVNDRGWNLFCNKRLILANDTTEVTGWIGGGDKSALPKYHNTYNEFRGIVFLRSSNPFELPLNTSKSGVNSEHKTYHHVLNLMIRTARPVIDYLAAKYKTEKIEEESNDNIEQGVDDSYKPSFKLVSEIKVSSEFKAPKREDLEMKAKTARISYSKDKEMVVKAMKTFGVNTYKEVGEKTFDYYFEMEGLDE